MLVKLLIEKYSDSGQETSLSCSSLSYSFVSDTGMILIETAAFFLKVSENDDKQYCLENIKRVVNFISFRNLLSLVNSWKV